MIHGTDDRIHVNPSILRRMDTISAFLDGPRARGAFLIRSVMQPPWSLRIQDEAPLTLAAIVDGTAWIVLDGEAPQPLHVGDVAIIRGPGPYTVADDPSTPTTVVIHPGQHCTTPEGASLEEAMRLGVRTWGNSAAGSTTLVTGTYSTDGEISRRLLDALPPLILVRREAWDTPLVRLLADEIGHDAPGQSTVLDRLLDLLLIAALRTWFARPDSAAPRWYHAHADPVVGHALRLLHEEPARPWTVAELASSVGASRAALARRFNDVVGEPPMTFLASWRLALASDLLREPGATVTSVEHSAGRQHAPRLWTDLRRWAGKTYGAGYARRATWALAIGGWLRLAGRALLAPAIRGARRAQWSGESRELRAALTALREQPR